MDTVQLHKLDHFKNYMANAGAQEVQQYPIISSWTSIIHMLSVIVNPPYKYRQMRPQSGVSDNYPRII